MSELRVGDLTFEVRRSARRRTMQITVDRGGELVFSVPSRCTPAQMEHFAKEKCSWIYTKLAEKEVLLPRLADREYRSGEGFPYLGRHYRLLLVGQQNVPVKLEAGRFKMRRALAREGREHMVRWYIEHAKPWMRHRVDRFASRVGVESGPIDVRDLGFRSGSCAKAWT